MGVERRFFIERVLEEKYPDIKVKLFNTTSDALDAVSRGITDAYIGNRAVAMYIIERELITNLKIQGKIHETASIKRHRSSQRLAGFEGYFTEGAG